MAVVARRVQAQAQAAFRAVHPKAVRLDFPVRAALSPAVPAARVAQALAAAPPARAVAAVAHREVPQVLGRAAAQVAPSALRRAKAAAPLALDSLANLPY